MSDNSWLSISANDTFILLSRKSFYLHAVEALSLLADWGQQKKKKNRKPWALKTCRFIMFMHKSPFMEINDTVATRAVTTSTAQVIKSTRSEILKAPTLNCVADLMLICRRVLLCCGCLWVSQIAFGEVGKSNLKFSLTHTHTPSEK